jgi:ankyrin repeat protein
MLVEAGADLEARSRHETITGVRPLNTAAFARAHAVARVLLEAGADPNGEGEPGATPLMAAEANGDEELKRLLVEHGARPA